MTDLFDMTGKVAVVTGGSRGLGREMVIAFAEHGADVVIASRKLENCETVAEEVRKLGRRALPLAYHAASWDGSDQLAEAVYAEFGRIDVLVNNAGIGNTNPDGTRDRRESADGVELRFADQIPLRGTPARSRPARPTRPPQPATGKNDAEEGGA